MSHSAELDFDDTLEVPGMTPELRARLERLSPEKRQLAIDRLLAKSAHGRNTRAAAADALVPVARDGDLPLSFAQERLWVLHEMDRGDAAYNIPAALVLTGQLRLAALKHALREIVRRHETLRTTFDVRDGVPVLKIGSEADLDLPLEDLTHLPELKLNEARRRAARELEEPFDLRAGPVIRGRILRLDPDRHVLLLTVHHIVADGWSMAIIVRELEELYRTLASGVPLPPRELSFQYADYAAWQRNALQDGALEPELCYWTKQLEGAPAVLDLPSDRRRPPVRSSRGGTVPFEIGPALSEDLRILGQRAEATRYMVLLAAFSAFLYRISGQDDLVIGSPFAGRTHRKLEPLVGFFVNTLPLRCQLSGNPTFREFLSRVRRTVADANAHQQLPFEKLVENLNPDRNPSHTPIFQVVFGYQEDPPAAIDLPGLDITPLEMDGVTSKHDLTLLIENRGDTLSALLEYSSDLFLPRTARRYAECFQQMLHLIAESPDTRLDEIQLLAKEDKIAISRWSGTSIPYPSDRSIHSLFEEEAEKHPQSLALVTDQGSLTYRKLNERANRLAHVLLARGVTPGMSVGICLRRGVDLVTGILAILKSGGAYVPLDPEYPRELLQFMLDDAETQVVVTDFETRPRVENADSHRHIQVLCGDLEESVDGAANPGILTAANQVAYIMYTSGSTGSPKGVEIPHRAVVRLVRENDFMEFSEREVFLQFAPVSFDASTLELWGPLLNGGKLAIPPPQALSLDQLGEQVNRHGVTTLWLTSGLFNLMVDERIDDLRGIRQLLAGGDVLSVSHVQKALEALPDTRLINGYGPTENTTFTCCFTIPREDWTDRSIPIGRPIANTHVCIVDQNLRLVPPGVAGELLIGGDGLFLGYKNQPELNRQKLIRDPFSSRADDRLYRTGDRVRYLEDGTIEFIGRLDDQVKIRGFRVEPGEIESVLVQHPDLRESVVVARQDFGQKELAAYVVREESPGRPRTTDAELVEALRAFIDQKLPSHLTPSSLTVLDALPLSPNGKVDRARLPVPSAPVAQTLPVAPGNDTEQKLWELWRDVLGREAASTADSFFDIGGNSLLATQIISRIRRHYGLDIPIHDLFRYSTIRDLGTRIDQLRSRGTETSQADICRLQPQPGQAAELSFAQERLWFLDCLEPDNPYYNVAFAHHISGPLEVTALERSLTAVVQRHDALRASFIGGDEQAHIRLHDSIAIQIPVTDMRDVDDLDREVIRRSHEEARLVFDLAKPPLLRARLLVTGAEQYVLLMTMHHIVSDGWSLGVLVRELVAYYMHFTTGEPTQLAELPIQYADFSRWQKKWFEGDQATNQLSYWQRQLSGFPTELKLPTDRSRPPTQSFRGSSVRFEVDAKTTQRLNQLCRRSDATMFMVLLSAFNLLLYRYSEQEDIIVGSPVANRNHDELEPLIGFFVNTLALRTDLSGNPSFGELVGRVRKICLDAFANQDYPFEKVVDELQPERDLSRNPLFQVMFALQNAPEEKLEIPGLSFSVLDLQRTTAQFDIVLDMWERDEGLLGVFEFSTDLFDEPTFRRMAGHLATLLKGVAEDDSRRLSEFQLIDSVEERRLLIEFSGPLRSYPVERTLHALFEESAERYPNRTAAAHRGNSIQYTALNARANQIAWSLRACNLQPNQFVAIFEPRSIDFLASMLGVLKAGGAFLPIDSQYPEDRIRFMLEDSQVAHLITTSGHLQEHELAVLGEGIPHVLLLDDDAMSEWPSRNPAQVNTSSDLAYMIYTSGSTGKPKGTMVRHDGAVNHIFGEFELLGFDLDTAFLQSAPASSDISIWQFLGPVLKGARTVVADFETVCDPGRLFGLIKRESITLIELVPVLLQGLLEHARGLNADERSLPDLEWAMVTGEVVTVPLVNLWLDTYPCIRLVNAYGPTEASDDTCQFVVENKLPPDRRSVPIGKPIPNMNHYVLDSHLKLVPIGVPGEICVSGIGVGEGYWHDEERTRAHFVPNPHVPDGPDGEANGILYRTGDRGYWRADGNLEYLERLDSQVKVRGFRIELGEIESLLADHPAVRETAVRIWEDEDGDRRLSAYFVPDLSSTQTREELAALRIEQLQLWKELHENSYQSAPTDCDPTFNTIGWDSNYTGAPLPPEDMKEYVDYTVDRVRSLGPGRVLEVGCGTGLVMFPLLAHCRSYTGMDLSRVAIDQLMALQARPGLQARVPGLAEAMFLQRPAHDLSGFAPASFDTVILASVVQYFPGIQYFTHVVSALLPVLKEEGAIFVGDVPSACLREVFQTSVQLYKAGDDQATADLLTRTRQRLETEQEMSIDPGFFLLLKDRFARINHVEILPKRGKSLNEMTRFRYDVLIHLDRTPPEVPNIVWQDWQQHQYSAEEIAALLRTERPPLFAVRNILNARVEEDIRALALLRSHRVYSDKAALMEEIGRTAVEVLDPEDLWSISRDLPYQVQLSMARSDEDGRLDALFVLVENEAQPPVYSMPGPAEIKPDIHCANNPLQEKLAQRIIPQLRELLREKVPAYMVPSDFVLLSRMPLTPSGKIDRSALPKPDGARLTRSDAYRAPRTDAECRLGEIWTLVLGVEAPDIGANFFDLGGHSLKATQVASRIHREFGVEIALRRLFDLPTIEELAAHLEGPETATYAGIASAEPADHYPLSHAQRRLWILAQIEETSSAYNMPTSLLLEGPFDHEVLGRAFQELAQRHESLRTRFVIVDDEPRQKIDEHLRPSQEYVDLSLEEDPDAQARELARLHARKSFDLARGPLVRISILKLADERHVLLFNMHHIIADDWSMSLLVREIGALYDSFRRGLRADLRDVRIQYKDYAVWQNQRLAAGQDEPGRAFWLSQFATPSDDLDLPTDEPRPPVKTYRGRSVTHMLDTATIDRLRAFNQESGVSMFMTLVTCVNVLLYRYTGQEDITIGLPSAGRAHVELEELIGVFINTLPFRMRVDPESTLQELLSRASDQVTACLEHQMYPADRLIDELKLRRDVSRSPLYDVTVTLQNVAPYELSLPEVVLSTFVEDYDMSKFDLSFNFQEVGSGLRLDITYNSDLFLRQRAERITRHFEQVVKGLLQDSKQTIAELDILPSAERDQVLGWCNPRAAVSGMSESLTAWFERQASQTPDHTALIHGAEPQGQRLTYRELNEQANQLARRLREQGIQRGDLVGLYMDRSIDVVVSILGILKTGAAYVPLDPVYPDERVTFMIRDAKIGHIVTRSGRAEELDLGGSVQVVDLDRDAASIRECSSGNLGSGADSHDPAYVIYTSGSTGQPKGVIVSHANVTRLFGSTENWFAFDDTDTWTLFHSYAFDFSVWEIWGALLYGGRLVVVPQQLSRSPADFLELLEREKVTVLNQTPSAFQQLIAADADTESRHTFALRYVIFGGEALDFERLRPWFERHGNTGPLLVNMYGITETTVHVTYRPIRLRDLDRKGSLIGEPLPDLHVYIVDRFGNPSPLGVPGEIWVGGDGVAQGYLRREQLTEEKFTADPFRADGQGRVYRSGDLARFLPDGDIEYLGRIDSQVQIRGFRVELGEIEARIATHPFVSEAAVVADRRGTDSRLIAYCLAATNEHPAADGLRRYLAGSLPEYMIPSHFVFLDAFPLTDNGKLDLRRLPALENYQEPTETYVTAANRTEKTIAAAFSRVLGVDRVSRDANFFDLGMHSMSIVSVHRHLQQEHGMDLSIVSFYEFPTVASLAAHIAGEPSSEAAAGHEATDRAELRRSARQRRRG